MSPNSRSTSSEIGPTGRDQGGRYGEDGAEKENSERLGLVELSVIEHEATCLQRGLGKGKNHFQVDDK